MDMAKLTRKYTSIGQPDYTWWFKPITMAFGLSKVEYVSLPSEGRYFEKDQNCGCCRLVTSIMLWLVLLAFIISQMLAVTCEFNGMRECEFSSTERQEKWAAGDNQVLHNVHIRSRSNLVTSRAHTASIPHGKFGKYHANCGAFVRDPVDGGCDKGLQVQVPKNMVSKSWRDGGCSLFQKHWSGAWCTRLNASMQGTLEMKTTRSPPLNSFGAKKPPKTRFTLKSQEWNFHGEFHLAFLWNAHMLTLDIKLCTSL